MNPRFPTSKELAHLLEDLALFADIKEENPFKVRAFEKAADLLRDLPQNISEWVKGETFKSTPGIGPAMQKKILEYIQTGELKEHSEIRKTIPPILLELVKLPGLGVKKAKLLHSQLDIKSLGELRYACEENRLSHLKGFGEKTQEKILQAISFHLSNQNLFLLSEALALGKEVLFALSNIPSVIQSCFVGDLRRRLELVSSIHILVETTTPGALDELQRKFHGSQIPIHLYGASAFDWGHALLWHTGSASYLKHVQQRALQKKYLLNAEGFFRDKEKVFSSTEEEILKLIDEPFVAPELREDLKVSANTDLISLEDLKGVYHVHTTASDGKHTLREMVEEARAMGFSYLGISDHSQSAFYANGLKESAVKRQHEEIDALNASLKNFKILKGIESDILADGSLDYQPSVLEKFDFVIASIHSRFNMDSQQMTQRLVAALKNPYTTMLGHMTGRLLLSREGYGLDYQTVFEAAGDNKKIIEINANPQRLDIDWRLIPQAKEAGVRFAINPDAHRKQALADVSYGVFVARKGGLGPEDVVNTRELVP